MGGAGFVLTTFATSVQIMYVTIGLILGKCDRLFVANPVSNVHSFEYFWLVLAYNR